MSAVLVESGLDAGAIWHFGQPNHEQRELAAANAWADLSHRAVITISGSDRTKWINDMMTQELNTLPVGQWTQTLLLDPHGHIEQQLFLVDDGQVMWMHTESVKVDELVNFLNKMRFMLDVDLQVRTSEYAVLRAPGVADAVDVFVLILGRQLRIGLAQVRGIGRQHIDFVASHDPSVIARAHRVFRLADGRLVEQD